MSYLLKRKCCLLLFTILTIAMQITVASSLLTTEATLKSSGLISYSQSLNLAIPLHVEGEQIKNGLGETIHLRGFNVMGHFHDCMSGEWGAWDYYDTAMVDLTFDKLKSYGVNFVREMTNVKCWIDNPTVNSNVPNLKYRDMLKDTLSRARDKGIYVSLVDYTVKPYSYNDQDYCGYANFASEDERDVLPTKQAFIDYVIGRTFELGQFENYIAEFWNEPYYMAESTCKEWQSVWQAIIGGLRMKGYKGLVLAQYSYGLQLWIKDRAYGNLKWYYNYPLNDPLGNIVVSFHVYRTNSSGDILPGLLGGAYTYNDLKRIYDVDFHIRDISLKVPVMCGEFGPNLYATNEDQFLANSLQIFNEWGISYAAWNWADIQGFPRRLLEVGTRWVTGGTPNRYGQIVVAAIKGGK